MPDDELSQSPKSQKLLNLEYLSQNVHYSIQTQGQNDTPSFQNELTSEINRKKYINGSEMFKMKIWKPFKKKEVLKYKKNASKQMSKKLNKNKKMKMY